MAQEFALVGLAASIVTFADLTAKVLARFRKFNSTAREMPQVFQDIHRRLPLILDIVVRVKEGGKEGNRDRSQRERYCEDTGDPGKV